MSFSKLESLPNEILIDTLEKYVNGVDIFVALNHQLNSRFDALIAQCQQLHFNFIRCQKDSYRLCLKVLPNYFDKIIELALSEEDAPGQIYDFLQLFPSFASFKWLRTLNFHCSSNKMNSHLIQNALLSLSSTSVETLSIKIKNEAKFSSLNTIISAIIGLPTLKRFFIGFTRNYPYWQFPTSIQSNIEHMTIAGLQCDWKDLRNISQCVPGLKYLNVKNFCSNEHRLPPITAKNFGLTLMPLLRTLILNFINGYKTTFDVVKKCLNATPNLSRLEITNCSALFNAYAWEMYLQTSLPELTYFILTASIPISSNVSNTDPYTVLAPFQTPFWITKKNFHIIITEKDLQSYHSENVGNARCRWEYQFDTYNGSAILSPVVKCWIAPQRALNDDVHIIDSITGLSLVQQCHHLPRQYYFGNVKFLEVNNLNKALLEWLTTYVNCTRITELIISLPSEESNMISLLMEYMTNIRSFQIDFDQLNVHQAVFIRRNSHIKSLDISEKEHTFSEENIITIVQIFPSIEHLIINTADLYNIPLLNIHLPNLRSLTFRVTERYFQRIVDFQQNQTDNQSQHKIPFSFELRNNWITIWIDQAAFDKSFWHTFKKNHCHYHRLPYQ